MELFIVPRDRRRQLMYRKRVASCSTLVIHRNVTTRHVEKSFIFTGEQKQIKDGSQYHVEK